MYILEIFPPFFPLGNVIVYGNTIDIYTTVEALLSLGIAGSRIHLVHPPAGSSVTCLNNAALEGAVQDALSRAGVSVHRDGVLARWGCDGHADRITWAAFTTDTKPFQLQCSVSVRFHCIAFPPVFQAKTSKSSSPSLVYLFSHCL